MAGKKKIRNRNGSHHNGASRSRPRSNSKVKPISNGWLRDFLSEMLAVEKGGIKLYEKALRDLQHHEYQDKLEEFHEQTERHVELCTDLLKAAGAEADYYSPGAEAADHKAEGLLSTEVPDKLADLNNIENLVLAETKDHWNWEILASIQARIGEADLKRMAAEAVREVRKQEQTHLDWNEQTLSALAMEAAEMSEDREFEQAEAGERAAIAEDPNE
jgi:hypothetical protein